MQTPETLLAARGITDREDRLLSADQPLAELQQRCGGQIPGKLAIPELLELVQQGRTIGLRLAREFSASDGDGRVTGFVRIRPEKDDPSGGCEILIENWRREAIGSDDDRYAAMRQDSIDRATAEYSARLDGKQRLLAGEGSAADLTALIAETRKNSGKHWTDYLELVDVSFRRPMHWRLLDGVKCKIDGSQRQWFARLIPIGNDPISPRGFELLLIAEQPLPAGNEGDDEDTGTQLIGDALSPALRSPVARIVANADKIRGRLAGPLRQEYAEYAGDIAAAGRHLASLLEDLHELESIESAGFGVASQDVNLTELAEQSVKMMQAKAKPKSISLQIMTSSEAVKGKGDAKRILQVLLNLIGNAINYSPEQSTVTVGTEIFEDSSPAVVVSDEGPGLSLEQQKRVFAKFERLGRSGDGGSGLGLYISRRLCEAMGGKLKVESEPGKGAKFIVALPPHKK